MGRNWAITIGINGYRNLHKLGYAKRDAESVREYFSQDLCFEQVYHFSDDSPPIPQDYGDEIDSRPTYATLRRFLRVRFEESFLRAGDNLWFFFAGHGVRHEDRDYLMPIDGDPGDVESTAIPLYLVTERLRRCGADNVILLVDACRSGSGRRDGVGVGEEQQQGVITLFSCSPRESSYEIDELQQGAFTYALLESLRIQGEGNCATVERLYQRLHYRVSQLSQQYQRPQQTPYGFVEPLTKNHPILLPRQASINDILALKNDAYRAESRQELAQAKQLWIRVLAVSSADPEGIEAIERLARVPATPQFTPDRMTLSSQDRSPVPPELVEETEDITSIQEQATFRDIASRRPVTPPPPVPQPSPAQPSGTTPLRINRKQFLKWAGFGSAGLVTAVVGREIFRGQSPTPEIISVAEPKYIPPTEGGRKALGLPLWTVQFETVTVDKNGQVVRRDYNKQAKFFKEDLGNNVTLEMVEIPPGSFQMGSLPGEKGHIANEEPQHMVKVPAFFIGRFAVTQEQYQQVMDDNPSEFKEAKHPVHNVSWHHAEDFCEKLRQRTGREYRLPSEAEWEYACRAGTTTPFHFGETITGKLANYNSSAKYASELTGEHLKKTTPVGSFPPNAFGLYDMHGNVREWCADTWHDDYFGAPKDGSAWLKSDGDNRFRSPLRGGSWGVGPDRCRSANRRSDNMDRNGSESYMGFRVVCGVGRTQ